MHILTAQLELRPIAITDAMGIYNGYARSPGVVSCQLWEPPANISETTRFIRKVIRPDHPEKHHVLIERRSGLIIGAINLRENASGRMRLSEAFDPAYSGLGYGPEIWSAMLDRLLLDEHRNEVSAKVHSSDLRTWGLLKNNLGFTRFGSAFHTRFSPAAGGTVSEPVVFLRLTRTAWIARRQAFAVALAPDLQAAA